MTQEGKELSTTSGGAGGAMMVATLGQQISTIQLAMKEHMKDGVHFGTIPGCGDKPALLKPGAEKLIFMFGFAPKFKKEITDLGGGHREYEVTTEIYAKDGTFLGEGVGSCSTHESKYRWRQAAKACPECGNVGSIFRSKAEYGGGYWCNKNKGGCGSSWKAGTPNAKKIDSQDVGRVENPDIADQYNTVLKMAKKRSMVDAALTVTAASDVFEQDLDEFSEEELENIRREQRGMKPETAEPAEKKPAAKKAAAKKAPPKPKNQAKEEEPQQAADQDQNTGDDTGSGESTFSLEDYKTMAADYAEANGGDVNKWWIDNCRKIMADLGPKKYDMLEKYLTQVHNLDMGEE